MLCILHEDLLDCYKICASPSANTGNNDNFVLHNHAKNTLSILSLVITKHLMVEVNLESIGRVVGCGCRDGVIDGYLNLLSSSRVVVLYLTM